MDAIVDDFPFEHVDEGSDDMPAHVKSSVFGCSLSIPITDSVLNLGFIVLLECGRESGSTSIASGAALGALS
jgi:thiamine phosphate synthase YjbQ (UPF0047 family)